MLKDAWEVLLLFLIPIGGGIPAGVLLAHNRGLTWPIMSGLYLVSDVILACVFEPTLHLFVRVAKSSPKLAKFNQAFKVNMQKTIEKYGVNPGPFNLILLSFGADPMTGRTAALAAGHNFVTGWTLAIIGDMFFFAIIMASTLWLGNILGDGTWTAVIITVAMIAIPALIRRFRKWRNPDTNSQSSTDRAASS